MGAIGANRFIFVRQELGTTCPPPANSPVADLARTTDRTVEEAEFALRYAREDAAKATEFLREYTDDEQEQIFGRITPAQLRSIQSWRGTSDIDDLLLIRAFTEFGKSPTALKALLAKS